jgi:hypothetical protein
MMSIMLKELIGTLKDFFEGAPSNTTSWQYFKHLIKVYPDRVCNTYMVDIMYSRSDSPEDQEVQRGVDFISKVLYEKYKVRNGSVFRKLRYYWAVLRVLKKLGIPYVEADPGKQSGSMDFL